MSTVRIERCLKCDAPVGEGMIYSHRCKVETNARLIAAAPDLLAALKDIIEGVDECWMFDNPGSVDRAQAAIDKAEGR